MAKIQKNSTLQVFTILLLFLLPIYFENIVKKVDCIKRSCFNEQMCSLTEQAASEYHLMLSLVRREDDTWYFNSTLPWNVYD